MVVITSYYIIMETYFKNFIYENTVQYILNFIVLLGRLNGWKMSRFDPHYAVLLFNLVFKTGFGFVIALTVAEIWES